MLCITLAFFHYNHRHKLFSKYSVWFFFFFKKHFWLVVQQQGQKKYFCDGTGSENLQIKANHSARLFCVWIPSTVQKPAVSVGGTAAGMNKMELQGEMEFLLSVPYGV